jgi:hypothetical protein
MAGGKEGKGPRFEPTSQQSKPAEQHKQPHQEGGSGAPGIPPTLNERAKPVESRARQPLPNVWNVLEREVRLDTPELPPMSKEDYSREIEEISRLQVEMDQNGTTRDNLIRGLYWTTISVNVPPNRSPLSLRHLSLEEFQKFRSQVEPLSEEELAEKNRKIEEESDQKRDEYRKRHKDDPPSTAHF